MKKIVNPKDEGAHAGKFLQRLQDVIRKVG